MKMQTLIEIAVPFLALLVGIVIGKLLQGRRNTADEQAAARLDSELLAARAVLKERQADLVRVQEEVKFLLKENGQLKNKAESVDLLLNFERNSQFEINKAKDAQFDELKSFVKDAQETLEVEFKAIGGDVLNDVSRKLTQTTDEIIEKHGRRTSDDVLLHKNEIRAVLKPVSDAIGKLDAHVSKTEIDRAAAAAVLDEQVKRLAGASESLTNALRKPVVRGSWGEITLENALESSGLQPETDYVLQHSTDAEDGKKRTDAVVSLPKGRKLVIDSKNLMDTYVALMSCEEDSRKAELAAAHSKTLKAHIRSLSDQRYWSRYSGLDCVILFVPHDGMYHAAVQAEAEIIKDACEKRVFIANPMSLITLLKAVGYVLSQERLNASAKEISEVGTDLYSQLARFAGNVDNLGNKLKGAVEAYNGIIPGLDRFIVSKARRLKELGASKGDEAVSPKLLEVEPRNFTSTELSFQGEVV